MSDKVNLSEYIAEHFGANASYVEGLLSRYKSDPNLVDESWRTFFSELLSGASPFDGGNGQAAAQPRTTTDFSAPQASEQANGAPAQTTAAPPKKQVSIALGADVDVRPIVGAGKKIVENMEQSLTVPTATSTRRVPVKLKKIAASSMNTCKNRDAEKFPSRISSPGQLSKPLKLTRR
jgi:2-oxoglutarate dehydrogenase E1 component